MRAAHLRSFLLSAALLGCAVAFSREDRDELKRVDPGGNEPAVNNKPCNTPACNTGKLDLLGSVQVSSNHKPLTKVSVTAYLASQKSKSVTTDDNGYYSFDDLKPGTYSFVFEKAGFRRVTRDRIQVKQDEGVHLNIEMEENRPLTLGPSPLHFTDL